MVALLTVDQQMTQSRALKSSSDAKQSEPLALLSVRLTIEQLKCLSQCARGISLRFEAWEIVNALVVGGYAEKGVAGVITVTDKGQQYLRTHPS